jgi:fructose-bisphosphate aldolase class I
MRVLVQLALDLKKLAFQTQNRRLYRQMLFEAPTAERYLSAAILDPETLYQKSSTNDKTFPEVLSERGN